MNKDPQIIGVAIRDFSEKYFMLPRPNRHSDLIFVLHKYYTSLHQPIPKITFQGFYTDENKVLSRTEAYDLAIKNGQMNATRSSMKLYSEDLW